MNSDFEDCGLDFWQEVNAKVSEAKADVAAGNVFDGDEVMREILRELDEPPKREK